VKVTKEWLIETIGRIPDGTELEITGHDYSLFVKSDPNYKEPERAPFPPDNIYPCSAMKKHMWGFHHCRHCDDEWPEPYLSERKRIEGY
jgi:hypothetical protein